MTGGELTFNPMLELTTVGMLLKSCQFAGIVGVAEPVSSAR